MQERKLSKRVEKRAQELPDAEFKKRYGKDWKSVKIATAQKQVNEIDMGTIEPILSVILMILGPVGIKLGFDQLIKLSEKYLEPLIDKFYGKVGQAAKFLVKHAKELREAGKQGYDNFEKKLAELISGLYEEQGCGCNACQSELDEKKAKRDRCLRIADRKFDKPSAYKSGAVVRCRKGKIWKGIKEAYDQLDEKEKETLRTWFKRKGAPGKTGGWVDCNSPIRKDGKITGYKPCGRQKGEKRKYPACRPTPARCKDPGKGKTWGKTNEIKLSQLLEEVIQDTLKQ